jgi:peroxiredoxin
MAKTASMATAPDFSARDVDNKEVHLSDFRGKKTVVLIFNRGFQ